MTSHLQRTSFTPFSSFLKAIPFQLTRKSWIMSRLLYVTVAMTEQQCQTTFQKFCPQRFDPFIFVIARFLRLGGSKTISGTSPCQKKQKTVSLLTWLFPVAYQKKKNWNNYAWRLLRSWHQPWLKIRWQQLMDCLAISSFPTFDEQKLSMNRSFHERRGFAWIERQYWLRSGPWKIQC
jgi:hypothetical protein